jgi:hypothetical protein
MFPRDRGCGRYDLYEFRDDERDRADEHDHAYRHDDRDSANHNTEQHDPDHRSADVIHDTICDDVHAAPFDGDNTRHAHASPSR